MFRAEPVPVGPSAVTGHLFSVPIPHAPPWVVLQPQRSDREV